MHVCVRSPRAAPWALCCLLGALLPRPVAAELLGAPGGVRSLAMGRAHRALGTGNETLWLNPAGMALSRRYSIDLVYGYGGRDHLNHASISAVDSKSGPVAGGIGYSRDWGNPSGLDPALNRFYAGAAYALGNVLSLGASAVNVRGTYRSAGAARDVDAYNLNVGVGLALGEVVQLGAGYENAFVTREPELLPSRFGAGLALRLGVLSVTSDWHVALRRGGAHQHAIGGGAEYLLLDALALRVGVRNAVIADAGPQTRARATALSGGVGVVTRSGGLAISCERTLQARPSWQLISSFQLAL